MRVSQKDRLDIHELAARYGNSIDERDWTRFRTVFTPDCRYELIGFGRLSRTIIGLDDLVDMMSNSADHPLAHHVTNVEIDASSAQVRMRSLIMATTAQGATGSASYDDTVVRVPDGWRIADRRVTLRRPQPAPNRR